MTRPAAVALFLAGFVAASTPSAIADSCLADPVEINPNMVTSPFGKLRNLPQYGGEPKIHWGVDFQARNPKDMSRGADLVSAVNGTVIGAGYWGSGYGNRVAIRKDNGDILIYSHMAQIEPDLVSGTAVGFKSANGPAVGSVPVTTGEKIGVAGGTSNHAEENSLAIHLHLEYVTNYQGTKLRETNDGTNTTRSRYMRNALDYMCQVPTMAPGVSNSTAPVPDGSGNPQAAEAMAAQPNVTSKERYGIPDAPPYDTYAGMSETQMLEVEMSRRTLDTDWENKIEALNKRGLWMEISRIDGVMLWIDDRISEKRSRIDAMLAMLVAQRANQFFIPRLRALRAQAERMSAAKMVN